MYIKKILAAVALIGIVALGYFSYHIYQSIFGPNTAFSKNQAVVYVPTGANYQTLLDSLQPLIKDVNSFDIVAQKKGYKNNIRPGRYILQKNMNSNEIVNILRSSNNPINISFNNQERLENLAGRIADQIEADSISLLQSFRDSTFLAENNFAEEDALSMYIPNKYEFYWNTSAEEFRERMLREYNRFWTEERLQKAEKIGLSPNKVNVLASIVQKETAKVDERPKVAGVYMNRYKNGWKLDADPTVIYAIKKNTGNFDTIIKRVLYKDLALDSPYNTYLYKELPPGPITMPDISSIDAVLNYQDHDYFYFVADVDNFGYHKFAKNLSQHNRNKQEYVRWINKQGIRR
ncbi:endolytic transglycosylase MltG [Zunongwangia sp. H14]|uniref:endolytic transglycosylase MltG n=1 Tax=Zunongwangia sp. H14 TaxID=3240792 RepID=UPI00356990BD